MRAACNAGPLIALGKLNALDVLPWVYDEILIAPEVYTEAVTRGLEMGHHIDAARIKAAVDKRILKVKKPSPLEIRFVYSLDVGEEETIYLAFQEKTDEVLVDNWHARTEARRAGLRVKGTLGILYGSLRKKFIDYRRFEALVKEITYREDIWISKELCRRVLKKARDLEKQE